MLQPTAPDVPSMVALVALSDSDNSEGQACSPKILMDIHDILCLRESEPRHLSIHCQHSQKIHHVYGVDGRPPKEESFPMQKNRLFVIGVILNRAVVKTLPSSMI